jgi:hypothetical protein
MTQHLLPGAALAVVDLAKLRDYCLSPAHARGRHKARVFRSALGLVQADAPWLREAILTAVGTTPAALDSRDRYGKRWRVDLALTRGQRTAIVRTLWLVAPTGGPPRLVTCFVA